jgi:hypothetical protein
MAQLNFVMIIDQLRPNKKICPTIDGLSIEILRNTHALIQRMTIKLIYKKIYKYKITQNECTHLPHRF